MFHLSLRRLDSEQLQKFAWLGVLPEDVTITPALAVTLWELSHQQARDTLSYFKSKALLLWYQVCDRLGQLASYVKNVVRAWQLAEEVFDSRPSDSIGLQCRYALIVSSLNSLAGNIPASFIAALVQKQLWTPTQGLAYAQQVQEPGRRAEALGKIAPHLPLILLKQTLEAARAIQHEEHRAEALENLAPYLLETLLPIALEAAQAIQDESERSKALENLAPHLPETLLPIALEAVRAIQNEDSRAEALSKLAPHLPETLLPIALEAARAIQNEDSRAIALIGIIPQLKSSFDFSLWKESLRILAYGERKNLLVNISKLSSVIIALGGNEALPQTARAIQEVRQQWP